MSCSLQRLGCWRSASAAERRWFQTLDKLYLTVHVTCSISSWPSLLSLLHPHRSMAPSFTLFRRTRLSCIDSEIDCESVPFVFCKHVDFFSMSVRKRFALNMFDNMASSPQHLLSHACVVAAWWPVIRAAKVSSCASTLRLEGELKAGESTQHVMFFLLSAMIIWTRILTLRAAVG